jgi:hypothetical protein
MRQSVNAIISDIGALDKTDSPQLRKSSQLGDGPISKMNAASKINVSNTVARLHKLDNCVIGDMATMSEVKVMEILP